MSCTSWPECTLAPRCARCLVLDVCRAQVPGERRSRWYPWAREHGYELAQRANVPMVGPVGLAELETARVQELAERVADRLLAWLRWPGDTELDRKWPAIDAKMKAVGASMRKSDVARTLAQLGDDGARTHPLESDERGKRLRAGAFEPCQTCGGRGRKLEYIPDEPLLLHRPVRSAPRLRTLAESTRTVTCDPWQPHWPTIAVICDLMTELGLWPQLHRWSPDPAQWPVW